MADTDLAHKFELAHSALPVTERHIQQRSPRMAQLYGRRTRLDFTGNSRSRSDHFPTTNKLDFYRMG